MEPTIRILNKIEKEGNLRTAASLCNYSYRKAWNILKQTEILFGIPLVEKKRGKGTQLSESGQKILDIFINNSQLFSSSLATANNIALPQARHRAPVVMQHRGLSNPFLKYMA